MQPNNEPTVENLVRTRLPTNHGDFMLYYYSNTLDNKEHVALVKGDVTGGEQVPVRVHSECFTGDILGSRRCDCGEQLQLSMRVIDKAQSGVLIYLRQEGRGIGLLEKLKAYNLQDEGLDTVDANIHLGYRPDERDYQIAALILKDLKVRSVRLITNNPQKISELSRLGIAIENRIPVVVRHNRDNEGYLRAKAERMNHLLGLGTKGLVSEEMSFLQPLVDQLLMHREVAGRRPFVTLSYAQSIDGSVAVRPSRPFSLSCQKSLEMTHLLRSLHDALLVGINTVLVDDPQLTVRHVEGDNPTPVILDSRLRFPEQAELLRHPTRKPLIITTDDAPEEKKKRLVENGARIFTVQQDEEGRVDLSAALELLSNLNFKTVMVEGGATVINAFLNRQFIDYCIVTVVPRIIGGVKAVSDLCAHPSAPPLTIMNCQYQTLDSDLIIYGPMGHR